MKGESIPEELRSLKRWVGRDGKIPLGKSNDPSTWHYFGEVVTKHKGAVSFALSKEDNLVVVNMNNCFENKVLAKLPGIMVGLLPSYTEVSMNGAGLTILGYADIPFNSKKKGSLEIHNANRFINMTGRVIGKRDSLRDIQAGIDQIVDKVFPPMEPLTLRRRLPEHMTSDGIIYHIKLSNQKDKFTRLMQGDYTGYDSISSAEFALLRILFWWLGDDEEMVRKVFTRSLLKRDKWSKRDGVYGTYLDRTIAAARSINTKKEAR